MEEQKRSKDNPAVVVPAGTQPMEIERMIYRAITEDFELEIESAATGVVARHQWQLLAAGFTVSAQALADQPGLARFRIQRGL